MKTGKKKMIIVALAIVCIVTVIMNDLIATKKRNINGTLSPETLMAMSYGTVQEEDTKVSNCPSVKFSAFFLRDNNGTAEKIKGTCKEIGKKDTLYVELNVLPEGHLDNAKITLNAQNIKWKTAIVSDNIVDGDYIGETSSIKLKDKLESGSQKMFWGTIEPNIGNNINNYHGVNSVTLTGDYVVDNNGETKTTSINETIELPVDWYGTTTTEVNKYYYSSNNYTSHQNQKNDIETLVDGENVKVKFQVAVAERSQQLLLQKQEVEITIPDLNGVKPTSAKSTDDNVTSEYNENEKKLKVTRQAVLDDEENITSTVARSNLNNIEVTYPLEAYTSINENSISLNIPVKATNYGYNNKNEEFKKLTEIEEICSSSAEGVIAVVYSNPSGDVWNVRSYVGNRIYDSVSKKYKYEISKQLPTNIYNGNVYEDGVDEYTVEWEVLTGKRGDQVDNFVLEEAKNPEQTGNTEKNSTQVQKNSDEGSSKDETSGTSSENSVTASDEFLNTSAEYESMSEYITTTGIYFSNATNFLGNDGWIELYNPEQDDSVIERFTAENWERYSKKSPYKVNLKSIKIKTSKPQNNQLLGIYQIKQIDDKALTEKYGEEDFEKLSYICTYLKGTAIAKSVTDSENLDKVDEVSSKVYSNSLANYDMPYSRPNLRVSPDQITNQKTEDVTFTISASSSNMLEKKWKNGVFLLQLPDNILNLEVKEVKSSDEENVKIKSYNAYEGNGKHYIKISTENEEETTFDITVKASITANPMGTTETRTVDLYAFNSNWDNYVQTANDEHDIDCDQKTDDMVGHVTDEISIIAPSGLLTTEFVTNYNNDKESKTIAPNIADIEKENGEKSATINVSITNNYSGTIKDVVILGKIPFEGNKYTTIEKSLNSSFTANIKEKIKVPEKSKEYVTTYYSSNENPTKDLNNQKNGWTPADKVTDWSEIKTYLICLNDYSLSINENVVFSYDVTIPDDVENNSASFSHHAVSCNLVTESGDLSFETEPNKVGIQVVSKFNFELTKNKKANDKVLVAGATYSVTTEDVDGNKITRSATTDSNGRLKLTGLYVGKTYTVKEISSTEDYVVSDKEIKFTTEMENGQLKCKVVGEGFKGTLEVSQEDETYLVKVKVEDEAKYTLVINKKDADGNAISDVVFTLKGKGKNTSVRTNEEGKLIITGLYPNEQYELKETKADGYYVDQKPRKFKIVSSDDGNLTMEAEDSELNNAKITQPEETSETEEKQKSAQAMVTLDITNEKIPTYKLKIIKVDEKYKESDKDVGTDEEKSKSTEGLLANAKFLVENKDSGEMKEYTTDENGEITISDLCVHEQNRDGNYITGEYIIQETKAPAGYSNNGEKIKLKVTKNGSGELNTEVKKVNGEGTEEGDAEELQTYKSVKVDGETVTLIIQDKPLFKLTKKDSITGNVLPNAKFEIYELDENGHEIGYAKDVNGNYVGEKYILEDGVEVYIVTTGEDGTISLPLKPGTYKAVEVGYPEGYQEYPSEQIFKIAGKDDESKEDENPEEDEEVVIDSIEDLVAFSEAINSGDEENKYNGYTVKLAKDLDFNDKNSYESEESYKRLENELTTGEGFTPIGKDETNCFTGTFDGQGHEIQNLYINTSNIYAGLFGYVKDGKIENLGVTGKVEGKNGNTYAGGIVGCINNCTINNCHNTCSITGVYCTGECDAGECGVAGIVSCIDR